MSMVCLYGLDWALLWDVQCIFVKDLVHWKFVILIILLISSVEVLFELMLKWDISATPRISHCVEVEGGGGRRGVERRWRGGQGEFKERG